MVRTCASHSWKFCSLSLFLLDNNMDDVGSRRKVNWSTLQPSSLLHWLYHEKYISGAVGRRHSVVFFRVNWGEERSVKKSAGVVLMEQPWTPMTTCIHAQLSNTRERRIFSKPPKFMLQSFMLDNYIYTHVPQLPHGAHRHWFFSLYIGAIYRLNNPDFIYMNIYNKLIL